MLSSMKITGNNDDDDSDEQDKNDDDDDRWRNINMWLLPASFFQAEHTDPRSSCQGDDKNATN